MLGVVDRVTALLTSLVVGLTVGAVFGFANVSPPAPQTWSGVIGIAGIVAGWMLISWLRGGGGSS